MAIHPPVRNHAKHDEDGGDIGKKNIAGQLGLVHVVLMQRHKNITRYTFKNSPLVSEHAEPLHIE